MQASHSPATFIGTTVLATTGTILTAWDYTDGEITGGGFIGLTLIIVGMLWYATESLTYCIRQTNRPADKAFELGYQMGYDKGCMDASVEDDADATISPRLAHPEASARGRSLR